MLHRRANMQPYMYSIGIRRRRSDAIRVHYHNSLPSQMKQFRPWSAATTTTTIIIISASFIYTKHFFFTNFLYYVYDLFASCSVRGHNIIKNNNNVSYYIYIYIARLTTAIMRVITLVVLTYRI